ncbi:MAG: hypothetical protein IKH93_07510 [Bacteroidales bacterium]|nr:hypothetical protein [Bacteroidales bacterium]
MKKFLAAFALLFFVFTASGQDAVMSSWPYLYPEFAKGTVWMNDGKKYERELNIHVAKGRLHFVDGGAIKEANPGEINLVELNGDQFTVLNGDVVKVSGDLDRCYVAKRTSIDYQKLNETDGPYGTKIDAGATLSLTTFELTGVAASYTELLRNRNEGSSLPLKNDYYLVFGGKVLNASKKAVENSLDAEGKAAFKTFQKQNKIKWQDTASLLQLVDFLAGL